MFKLVRRLFEKKGQAMVEFSLCLPIFFMCFFGLCYATQVSYNWAVLQFATNQGARLGSLGYAEYTIDGAIITCSERRVDCIEKITKAVAGQFGLEPIVKVMDNNRTDITINGDIQPEEFMFVHAEMDHIFNLMGSIATVNIHAETLTRNEPFVTGQ